MFDRFTENAKNAMNIAADISRRTRNSVVGSEHILLAFDFMHQVQSRIGTVDIFLY